ncbi:OCIA domain-containing protein 1 isoform X2 [Halyomorpha halys]|nr:OCIA domain-containing protein 1 isoform X2 [Halyomorpha halys]
MPPKGSLSEAETKALSECAAEAFIGRSLPLMILGGVGTYVAVSKGKLSPNPRWGATPKVILACTIAYFIGQMSYEHVCRQKLMAIPDSKIGEMIRKEEFGVPFNSDELRVLQECNRESFYQRCLPLSTIFGVGTYFGVNSGYLKPHPRFGAVPKVVGAVVLGYLMGKISYQGKCAEKLMALPDSKMGALLRNRRFGSSSPNSITLEDQDLERVLTDIPESEKYSDISNKGLMDLDTDRPLSGFDDFRPNLDDVQMDDGIPSPDRTRSISYDELRRRNREEFELKRTKPYR